MAGAARRMKVDVTSDVICPFCLLGIKQLEQAIDKYRAAHPAEPIEFDIRLLPFQLNGLLPDEPMPRSQYGAEKFGAERYKMMKTAMREKFRAAGVEVEDTDGLIASSHLAHRLQTYALERCPDRQLALCMDVFHEYHVKGRAPSDKAMLAEVAVRHGVFASEADARAFLDGSACDDEVKRAYVTAHKLGVTGVPFFVFQDKYAASGAMGTDEFVGIIEEISKREGKPIAATGEQCTPTPTAVA